MKTSARLKPVDAQLSPILAHCCCQMRSHHQRWHLVALLNAYPALLVKQRRWILMLPVQPVACLWMHLCQILISTVHNALAKHLTQLCAQSCAIAVAIAMHSAQTVNSI